MPRDSAAPADKDRGERENNYSDTVDSSALTAERAVAGALIEDRVGDIRSRILATVKDDDFTDGKCRFILPIIRAMVSESLPIDVLTIAGYIDHHGLLGADAPRMLLHSWLHEVSGAAPVPAMGEHYAAMVVEASVRNLGAEVGERVTALFRGAAMGQLPDVIRNEFVTALDALDRCTRESVTL